MVNKVTLIGNLGRDPEVRTLENGIKVGSFSLATNESYKDKNDQWQNLTEWHNIVVWRGLAEKAERDLKKGSLAYIEGKITHRKYQDKDGIERSVTDIVASNIQSLDKKEKSDRDLLNGGNFPEDLSAKYSSKSAEPKSDDSETDLPF
jgi:single-strand DNA-binding protein